MAEVCLVNKLIQMGGFCIFLNEVLNWLFTVSLNVIFKLYSEGAIQFLKYILSNPFKPSAAILEPLNTSNCKVFWCSGGY